MLPDDALPAADDCGSGAVADAVNSYRAWVQSFYRVKGEACGMLQSNTNKAAEVYAEADVAIKAAVERKF